jgi:O-antigen ligase
MWLLMFRVVVPGFFDYDADLDSLRNGGALYNQVIWLLLPIIGLYLISARLSLAKQLWSNLNRWFLVLIALLGASAAWSIDSGATIRQYIHLISIVIDAVAAALIGWHARRLQNVMRPILTTILLVSLWFGMTYPDLAITPNEWGGRGFWHGLATQKNGLAGLASLGCVFWMHAFLAKEAGFFKCLLGGGISFACLILSRGSSALMATIFCSGLLTLLLTSPVAYRRYMPYVIGFFCTIVLLYAVAVLKVVPGLDILLTPITAFSGKDSTFSDRAIIWQTINDHIKLSPLIGSGYSAYWVGPVPTSPSYVFLGVMWFYPGNSHNGYLEIINDVGFVGLAVLLAFIFGYIRQALDLMKFDKAQAALYLGLLFEQLLTNLSESHWFAPTFDAVVIFFASAGLARGLMEHRRAQAYAAVPVPTQASNRMPAPRRR